MDAANLARTLEHVHDADIADALNGIDPRPRPVCWRLCRLISPCAP
jgi:hypothetical protein